MLLSHQSSILKTSSLKLHFWSFIFEKRFVFSREDKLIRPEKANSLFFVLNLYLKTKNVFVFGLIITFSVETASTIISRLYSKKNILDSHKEHLYEVLVFKNKVSVIKISSIYGVIQLLLSGIVLISFYSQLENKIFYVTIFIYILIYFVLKYKLLKYAIYD